MLYEDDEQEQVLTIYSMVGLLPIWYLDLYSALSAYWVSEFLFAKHLHLILKLQLYKNSWSLKKLRKFGKLWIYICMKSAQFFS